MKTIDEMEYLSIFTNSPFPLSLPTKGTYSGGLDANDQADRQLAVTYRFRSLMRNIDEFDFEESLKFLPAVLYITLFQGEIEDFVDELSYLRVQFSMDRQEALESRVCELFSPVELDAVGRALDELAIRAATVDRCGDALHALALLKVMLCVPRIRLCGHLDH